MSVVEAVSIDPASEFSKALARAAVDRSILLIKAGDVTYRVTVTRVGDAPGEADEERVERSRQAIRETAGAWKGNVDAEALKAYIRERRLMPGRGSSGS
jgi:hypothetical protein